MAGDETPEMTDEQRLKNWQLIKTVLDYRDGRLSRDKATKRMSWFSGLLPGVCDVMLGELLSIPLTDLRRRGDNFRGVFEVVSYRRRVVEAARYKDRTSLKKLAFPHKRDYVSVKEEFSLEDPIVRRARIEYRRRQQLGGSEQRPVSPWSETPDPQGP